MSKPSPPKTASKTAIGVAAQRALHLELDAPPHLLQDTLACSLVSPTYLAAAKAADSPGAARLRLHCVLRSRYTEDLLARSQLRRVIVLGAGLDTLAFRQPPALALESVIEVDHPASQAYKRARLAAAGIALPPNTTLLPVDFAATTLAAALPLTSTTQPTFFACLGLLMYLDAGAIAQLLAYVSAHPPGSTLAFSFMPALPPLDPALPPALSWPGWEGRGLEAQAAAVGEPMLSKHTPEGLTELLLGAGFARVHVLQAAEAAALYPQAAALSPSTQQQQQHWPASMGYAVV